MCETSDLGRQEPRGCRHVYGDPATENWHFCQRAIKPGGRPGDPSHPPYCEGHTKTHLQATTEAARRNYLRFMERIALGDGFGRQETWHPTRGHYPPGQQDYAETLFSGGGGTPNNETDNLVPVDVHLTLANRRGSSHG